MWRVLALALAVSHGLVFDCAQPHHRSGTAVFAKDGLQGRKLGSARSKPRASDAVKDAIAAWEENGDIRGKEGRTGGPAASGERLRELALPLPDSASEAERSSAAPDYSKPEKGRPKGLLGWLRRREGGDDAEAEGAAKLAESSRLREEIAWAKSQDMPELAADLTRKLLDL